MDPERREHTVEAAVLERQVLGVALHPLDLDARLRGSLARPDEQLGREVERGHACAQPGGPDRDVAGAGGDVEHLHSGLDRYPLEQVLRRHGVDEPFGHGRVAARGPGAPVGPLQFREAGWAGGAGVKNRHVCLLVSVPGRPSGTPQLAMTAV